MVRGLGTSLAVAVGLALAFAQGPGCSNSSSTRSGSGGASGGAGVHDAGGTSAGGAGAAGQNGSGGAAGTGTGGAAGAGTGGAASGGAGGTDGQTYDCGGQTCTVGQSYCYHFTPGVAGHTGSDCNPTPDACAADPSCSCLCPPSSNAALGCVPAGMTNTGNFCSCSNGGGRAVVSCAGS